jgi:hypothetical protein
MRICTPFLLCASAFTFVLAAPSAHPQASGPSSAQVHLVITDTALRNDQELPPLRKEDLQVKLSKKVVTPTALIPAQGDQGGLQLMILVDDTLDQSVGNNLNDLREFIAGLPQGTQVGVAYMSNATINIAQNFTTERDLAAKAIRLPRGNLGAMDSSFFSLISLLKGWPQQKVRREVIMVTDGIDRLHGERPSMATSGTGINSSYGANLGGSPNYSAKYGRPAPPTVYHSMPTISQDAQTASELSQRYNAVVFTIYSNGVGRAGRSQWDQQLGLGNLTLLADETGGECFSLSTTQPVSFKPYLDRIQSYINNQYYLVLDAPLGKKDSLQRVDVRTNQKNSEIYAADNVWVPKPTAAK